MKKVIFDLRKVPEKQREGRSLLTLDSDARVPAAPADAVSCLTPVHPRVIAAQRVAEDQAIVDHIDIPRKLLVQPGEGSCVEEAKDTNV